MPPSKEGGISRFEAKSSILEMLARSFDLDVYEGWRCDRADGSSRTSPARVPSRFDGGEGLFGCESAVGLALVRGMGDTATGLSNATKETGLALG